MSFTVTDLQGALRAATGREIADGDAALAYVRLDQAALRREHKGRVRWERWDGECTIGAARPVDIRARSDYGGGEVYLVYIDDELVYLQPHDPEAGGYDPITEDELKGVATRHCAAIVDALVFEAAIGQALLDLPPAPPERPPTVIFTNPPGMDPRG